MEKIFKILFPFYKSSRYNFIIKKWWHRLFIVVFIVALIVVAWNIFVYLNEYETRVCDMYLIPGYGYNIETYGECLMAIPVHPFQNLGITVLAVIAVSYVLQLVYYKILIFIIFGKNK